MMGVILRDGETIPSDGGGVGVVMGWSDEDANEVVEMNEGCRRWCCGCV